MAKDIAQLITEATEAVKDVPDDLRPVAFQKAFDALAGEQSGGGPANYSPPSTVRRTAGGRSKRQTPQSNNHSSRSQLDQLDRTSHPKINQDATALANSLRVLQAARDDLGIDGLSGSDIAHVLTDKFRCQITRQAVSIALNRAGRYVNRHKDGNSVIFRIMSGGETYLSNHDSGAKSEPAKPTKKRTKSTKKPSSKKNTKKATATTTKSAKKSSSKKSPGAWAAVTQLYEEGFFSSAQTITSIIDHLKHSLGRTYKSTEMPAVLLRLLRNGKLQRTKNSDNQYEYKNA